MPALTRVLKHQGSLVRYVEDAGDVVDGDPELSRDEEVGEPFKCCLFLDRSNEDDRGFARRKGPQILIDWKYLDGTPIRPVATDKIIITADELGIAPPTLWQIDGDPQPLGKPGRRVLGYYGLLKRVEDLTQTAPEV